MSDENIDELETKPPTGEEGVFYVSQISPTEAEEEVKTETKELTEGDEEAAEEAEDEICSYQTEPMVAVKPAEIKAIADRILKEFMEGEEYNAATMKKTACQISVLIREEIKRLCLDRYRIISHVTVGQKCDQDIMMNFLYLWKPEFDHYVIAKYEDTTVFATALVFLIYKL